MTGWRKVPRVIARRKTGDAEVECVKEEGHGKSTIWLYSPSPSLEEEMKKHPIEHGPEELKLCMVRWEATI